MKRLWMTMLVITVLVAFAPGIWIPLEVQAQAEILRLSAEFKNFNNTESSTGAGVPGLQVYSKTLMVPGGVNTLYVTISTTADTHHGAALLLTALLDGVFFNPGTGGAGGAPAGWINLQNHVNYDTTVNGGQPYPGPGGGGRGDLHDNSIHYTWCTRVTPGAHTVTIRLATSIPNHFVFFEAAHIYIDASQVPNGSNCVAAP